MPFRLSGLELNNDHLLKLYFVSLCGVHMTLLSSCIVILQIKLPV